MNIWILLLLCIPAFVFWIILKVMRIKLYTYLRAKFPKKYSGYPGFGGTYLFEIFKPKKINDKRYINLIKTNRRLFIITLALVIITIYALFKLK